MGCLYSVYGISLLINQKLGIDNIYLNGALLSGFEILGYILIYYYANKFGRRQINIYSILFVLIISTVLVLSDFAYQRLTENSPKALWMEIIDTGRPYEFCIIR